jgi:hypothetical protein
MKFIARILQYFGVALFAHAVTMHMVVLRLHSGGDAGATIRESWFHVAFGAAIAVSFGSGIYLERRK